jgi:DNA-binding LacI/PurR family transcriptional regulator
LNLRLAEVFSSRGIPVILLDRDVCLFPHRSRFDLVGIDNFNAGYTLTEHLWSLGRRRILFITHGRAVSTVTVRIAGYEYALASHGVKPNPEWVLRGDTNDFDFVRRMVANHKPDGLVCVNDHEAAQLIRVLSVLGISVPKDVGIVSIDDDQWATYFSIALTTLRQPFAELGTNTIKVMLERLDDPAMPARQVCLACSLIVRESCGAKRQSKTNLR